MDRQEVLAICKKEDVRFLRLQFTDILGSVKNVEVPASQFGKALDGEIMFDGSSIEGFSRIEESDMLLVPDPDTFRIYPDWIGNENGRSQGKVARLICDVHNPDGGPFDGCPRLALKRACEGAKKHGYSMVTGPEAEFFLFQRSGDGSPTAITHDSGAYFDLAPVDKGEECRRMIVNALEAMGFEVEAAHHEVAPGQHEIDFRYGEAISTADNVTTFRHVVREVATRFGLHATFMPKPLFGQNGSGMHTHQSLFRDGKNAFYDPKGRYELSEACLFYIGGLMRHAKGMCAVTNPLVNSYKRLVPGYEAPTNIAWSERNRSPLIRIPARRGNGTRVELRMPDPSCNPYLAFAVMLASGMDGIRNRIQPPDPVNVNIYILSPEERKRLGVENLPGDLSEAVQALTQDEVVRDALGMHIFENFVKAKRQVWQEYIAQVHQWELDRYLSYY